MKRFRADTNIGVERIIRKGRLHHWNCRNWSISPYILSHVNMVLTDCLYQSWSSLRWVVRSCQESPCGAKNASDVFLMEQRKSVWQFLKSTLIQWLEDRPFQLASSLSYYTIFSLAPLLVIVIAIAGFAFGEAAAEQRIVGTIQGMIGEDSARAVQTMIENANKQRRGSFQQPSGFSRCFLEPAACGPAPDIAEHDLGSRTEARSRHSGLSAAAISFTGNGHGYRISAARVADH